MKISALTAMLFLVAATSFAQWNTNGNNIYNSNSGNVGIGIAAPEHKLHISGDIRLSGSSRKLIVGPEGGANDYLLLQDVGSGTAAFQWVQDSSPKFTIDGATGNVGIGNASPTDKLNVSGDIRLSGSSRKLIVGSEENISDYLLLQDAGSGTPSLQWVQDGLAKLTIDGVTGNVGIGNTSPADKLNVNGDIRLSGSSRKLIVGQEGSINDYLMLQDVGSGTPAFQWVQDGSAKFSIDGVTGNVGIGTTEPDAKLTVRGDIHTREVRVDISGGTGPDYVFEKDYDLLPLTELETYINQNKHLPEVPSAKEMEANGLNLKEMNLILLKKVEELTLHLIDANKKIEVLNKEVREIKTKN